MRRGTHTHSTHTHTVAQLQARLTHPHNTEYQRQAHAYPVTHHSHRRTQPALWDSAGDYSDLA
jgi:hypothetical protein